MPKKSGIIKFLSFLCFAMIGVIVYCFLDVAKIIEVDEKYSLKNLFFEEIQEFENIISEDTDVISEINRVGIEEINTNVVFENVEAPQFSNNINIQTEIEDTDEKTELGMQDVFYYNQLDEYGKVIYARLTNEYDNLKNGTYKVDFDKEFNSVMQTEEGREKIENSFQAALNAIIYDRPEFFFIEPNKLYFFTETTQRGSKYTYTTYLGAAEGDSYLKEDFSSAYNVNNVISELEKTTLKIVKETDGSDYQIIKHAHDWIVENVEYDQTISQNNIYDIYGVFNNKIAVCAGYAQAFKYILDRAGIPCIYVAGVGINDGETESHAWNYVYLDENWYLVDCTWDDPILIGSYFGSEKIRDTYFLKGSNSTQNSHIPQYSAYGDTSFEVPQISKLDYKK